jgi:hypothetical protein
MPLRRESLTYGKLVEKHLRSLVRVSHLDASHESGRLVVLIRHEQVVALLR